MSLNTREQSRSIANQRGVSPLHIPKWKVEQQQEFVGWWREKVRGDGKPSKTGAGRGRLPREDAESMTGITQQQVARWSKRLQKWDDYRATLYGGLQTRAHTREAGGELRGSRLFPAPTSPRCVRIRSHCIRIVQTRACAARPSACACA